MKVKHALLVYKKSSYQQKILEEKSVHYKSLLKRGHQSVQDWTALHEQHLETIRHVEECLRAHGISFRTFHRFEMKPPIRENIIITVGGDGTFLEAAHYAQHHVMFGVNSAPTSSVGYFAAATHHSFEKKLKQLLAGRSKFKTLQRLQVWRGHKKAGPPALNEVLYTSENAGATSRYWIQINRGVGEEQKSSGIWIATPSGSTAAIHSAGGKRLPMETKAFAYLVRELYRHPKLKYHLKRGILKPNDSIQLTAKMDDPALFIDGSHIMIPLKRGETITIKLSTAPLKIVA